METGLEKYLASNRISFLRLTGIKKFLFVNVFHGQTKLVLMELKLPVIGVAPVDVKRRIRSVKSITIKSELGTPASEEKITGFIREQELNEVFAFAGINEFRSKIVSIPKDDEEIDIWFLENSSKILPQTDSDDNFVYSYEQINEDEDNRFFLVTIARKDHVNSIIETFDKINNCTLLNISPFPLSFAGLKEIDKSDSDYLYIQFNPDSAFYTLFTQKKQLYTGEQFYESSGSGIDIGSDAAEQKYEKVFREVSENIKIDSGNLLSEGLVTFAAYNDTENESIRKAFSRSGIPGSFNKNIEPAVSFNLPYVLHLQKLFEKNDSLINLIPQGQDEENRSLIEKNITNRILIACGGILIALLLLLYVSENYLNGKIAQGEDALLEVQGKLKNVERIENENQKLAQNLIELTSLKNDRSAFAYLLKSLSSAVSNESFLIGVNVSGNRRNIIEFDIDGVAFNETEMADIIKRLEDMDKFDAISLEFANVVERKELKANNANIPASVVKFKINGSYDTD